MSDKKRFPEIKRKENKESAVSDESLTEKKVDDKDQAEQLEFDFYDLYSPLSDE